MQTISNWSASLNAHGHSAPHIVINGVGDQGEDDSKTAIATDAHGKEHMLIV